MVISGITVIPEKESRSLIGELLEHTTSAPYVYSHRWNQGDLVVWDNLATLHAASPLRQLPPAPAAVPRRRPIAESLVFTPPDDLRREHEGGPVASPRV